MVESAAGDEGRSHAVREDVQVGIGEGAGVGHERDLLTVAGCGARQDLSEHDSSPWSAAAPASAANAYWEAGLVDPFLLTLPFSFAQQVLLDLAG
jgi:hypothetical protein